MSLALVSLLAGVLTILAPCILPLLPVVVGGSLTDKQKWRPFLVTGGLVFSVLAFTLLLKSSTLLIDISDAVWQGVVGGIVFVFGVLTVFPKLWAIIVGKLHLETGSSNVMQKANSQQKKWFGPLLLGASLGPVFTSCSPTYVIILAVILPQSFGEGFVNLLAFALGLGVALLVVGLVGQKVISKLQWAADPEGIFRKVLGLLFVIIGLAVMTGLDKKVEIYLIDRGFIGASGFETQLLQGAGVGEADDMLIQIK